MMFNADEYWAEGCQSWFDATIRTDVNSGINTRDKLKAHDTHFAQLLEKVCVWVGWWWWEGAGWEANGLGAGRCQHCCCC
jgi:hypothetical protein